MQKTLAQIGRRTVIVVTDRYPPSSHGGAEVSLHIALSALPAKEDLLVVTSTGTTGKTQTYEIEGVRVLVLPAQARWPEHHRFETTFEAPRGLQSLLSRFRARREESAASATERSDARRLVDTAVRDQQPEGGVVRDFVEYPEGRTVEALREVFEFCRPRLIHADNYRSICAATLASEGMDVQRIGLVRDNRFHCVRHDQSMLIEDQFCVGCDLACAPLDLPEAPDVQRDLLGRARDFRRARLDALDRVVVTSAYLEREISRLVPAERIIRVANASGDVREAEKAMSGVAERPGTNLLIVGMLNGNKGQAQLIERIGELSDRVPDVVVHLAGRGARVERRIFEAASAHGLEDRVVLHGFVDRKRLYQLYRECQIIVLPTRWPEPFGRVPLEAGLARRPCVSFAVGGLQESIVDGETGYLVPAGNYEGLFRRIGELAVDPGLRFEMGARARKHVLKRYDSETLANELFYCWEDLIDLPFAAERG